ncbi:MAG: winged helix-turn-helix transcriptional regulator [Spirochaetaceae bacterium]
MDTRKFRRLIYDYYELYGRPMPWRSTRDPYRIFVSEIMLQQTQVPRVMEKYPVFIERFPDFHTLAGAELREVLVAWQGLGYNRRAKYLRESAIRVVSDYRGVLPSDTAELVALPGVGSNTAGSVAAFAYDVPAVFIETNIRRVFIHFFFPEREEVSDREILPLVERTLPREDPRRWYYALMDYGAMLATWFPNPNRRSAHYTRQSPFENSDRQIRGRLLRALSEHERMPIAELEQVLGVSASRARAVAERLESEGFIIADGGTLRIR